jgi:hypothetical protein
MSLPRFYVAKTSIFKYPARTLYAGIFLGCGRRRAEQGGALLVFRLDYQYGRTPGKHPSLAQPRRQHLWLLLRVGRALWIERASVLLLFEGWAQLTLLRDTASVKSEFITALMVGLMAGGLPYGYVAGLFTGTALYHLTRGGRLKLEHD